MSLKLQLRGRRYRAIGSIGGRFWRVSLGTENQAAASTATNKIERAIADGKNSSLWPELKRILPPQAFKVLAKFAGYVEPKAAQVPTWAELEAAFAVEMEQRIALGDLARSTRERYLQAMRPFREYLAAEQVSELPAMDRAFMQRFKVWRMEGAKAGKHFHGGRGLAMDGRILRGVFSFAVRQGMISSNPVSCEKKTRDAGRYGAQPFSGDQLKRLREAAGPDLLAFLLLRHTGLRGSDAVRLTWGEIDLETRWITRLTQKNKKTVVVPISTELLFALENLHDSRNPKPSDVILLNPETGRPMSRARLCLRMLRLGKRAGVEHANSHRYRDTFAVDGLVRGLSMYELAQLLGDTTATVEEYYAQFVKELRDRVRAKLDQGEGIEKMNDTILAHHEAQKRPMQ